MASGTTEGSSAGSRNEGDGRHRRRQRNRQAALDALVALLDEGNLRPTAAEVAARAGLSARSMFRYFDDVADLHHAAIRHLTARVAPALADLTIDPSKPVQQRADGVARALDRLYAVVRTGALAARLRAPDSQEVAEQIALAREIIRGSLLATFGPELQSRPARARRPLLAALEIWCTFETQHLLRAQGAVEGVDPVKVTAMGMAALLARPA